MNAAERFIDNEYTSLHQALIFIAESNETNAGEAFKNGQQQIGQMLLDSARSWREKAQVLMGIYAAIPSSDAELLLANWKNEDHHCWSAPDGTGVQHCVTCGYMGP